MTEVGDQGRWQKAMERKLGRPLTENEWARAILDRLALPRGAGMKKAKRAMTKAVWDAVKGGD